MLSSNALVQRWRSPEPGAATVDDLTHGAAETLARQRPVGFVDGGKRAVVGLLGLVLDHEPAGDQRVEGHVEQPCRGTLVPQRDQQLEIAEGGPVGAPVDRSRLASARSSRLPTAWSDSFRLPRSFARASLRTRLGSSGQGMLAEPASVACCKSSVGGVWAGRG